MLLFWKRHTNYTDKIHTKHNIHHYFHEAPWSSSIADQGPKTDPHRTRHTRPSSKNLQHLYAHATYKCNNKLYICKQAQDNVEKNYERDEWTSIACAKGTEGWNHVKGSSLGLPCFESCSWAFITFLLRESVVTFVLKKDQPNLHPLGTSKNLYTLFSHTMYGTCSP